MLSVCHKEGEHKRTEETGFFSIGNPYEKKPKPCVRICSFCPVLLALICIEFSVAAEMSTLGRQDIENWQVRDEFNDYDEVD